MNASLPLFRWITFAIAAVLVFGVSVIPGFGEDAKAASAAGGTSSPTEEQEAKLTATLKDATLKGRWAAVKDGQLGPEKEDAYQIVSVKKIDGDKWQVNARMQYGGQSMDLPIPVIVKWSGDTPVLLFDDVNLGGPRSYSARLMISGNTYAGSWSGGDHGGMLYGVITHGTH